MLQPVFDFIEKFATDFSWKRLVISIGFVTLGGAIFFLYESQTATTQLSKYERSVAIIEKLELLNMENAESKEVTRNIYSGLANITKPSVSPAAFKANLSTELKQALLAASPWLLFCLFFLPGYLRRDSEAPSIVGGSLALALIMGMGGYFIPIEWGSWVGYGAFPFGANLILFALLMFYGNREKS